jgi:hypothetical protein
MHALRIVFILFLGLFTVPAFSASSSMGWENDPSSVSIGLTGYEDASLEPEKSAPSRFEVFDVPGKRSRSIPATTGLPLLETAGVVAGAGALYALSNKMKMDEDLKNLHFGGPRQMKPDVESPKREPVSVSLPKIDFGRLERCAREIDSIKEDLARQRLSTRSTPPIAPSSPAKQEVVPVDPTESKRSGPISPITANETTGDTVPAKKLTRSRGVATAPFLTKARTAIISAICILPLFATSVEVKAIPWHS